MGSVDPIRSERGQGTVEWIGLVLLVALAVAGFAAVVGVGLPGVDLARALGAKLACAVGLSGSGCEADPLAEAYGRDLAAAIREHAPDVLYEEGMLELPVDYRECREDPCSIAAAAPREVWRTDDGLAATAFTHVVDCRAEAIDATEREGRECSGARAGFLYVQYWMLR